MHFILPNKLKKPRQGLNNNRNSNSNSNNKKTIFSGTFAHERDENYEQFLKQIGEKNIIFFFLVQPEVLTKLKQILPNFA